MTTRSADGSAGDADYATIGTRYSAYRRPDPRIAAHLVQALGSARTVLNVGAGAGSYEPTDRAVTAVEPSATMRAQRPPHLGPALDAVAENLPFQDNAFDAAMATYSVHQWNDVAAGLRELRRVTSGPIVIMTGDPSRVPDYWLGRYAPEMLAVEASRYPSLDMLAQLLDGSSVTVDIPIPLDCTDGFIEAYYGRPEMFLDPDARRCCSAWSFVDPATADASVAALGADLSDGSWDAEFAALRTQPTYVGSLVLLVNTPLLVAAPA